MAVTVIIYIYRHTLGPHGSDYKEHGWKHNTFCQTTVKQCCFLKQCREPLMSVNFHTVKFIIPIIHYFHICHWFSYSSPCSYLPLHTAQQHQPTMNPCTEKFSNQSSVNFVLFCSCSLFICVEDGLPFYRER